MYSLSTVAALATLLSTTLALNPPDSAPGFSLHWSETFAGSSVNTTKWAFWDKTPSNGEQEIYPTNGANCQVTAGSLKIDPLNSGGQWTSCRIESHEEFSASPGGKLLVQASLKLGDAGAAHLQGIWPAFWSLGVGIRHQVPWPECGEIDTFENVNGAATGYGTVHCGTAKDGPCHETTGLSTGIDFDHGNFHTWAHVIDKTSADWTAQSITFLLDGKAYKTIMGSDVGDAATWGTLVGPMFITLNVAVGGNWPGSASGNTASGETAGMEVQWVAVYDG